MKSFTRILIIAGVVVVAAVAVWYGVNRSQVASDPGATVTPSASPEVSITPLAIAYDSAPGNWVTYSSASTSFSVKYPPDWRVGPCGPQCVGWAPGATASGQLVLGIIESTNTIETLLQQAEPYLVTKEDVKVGGLTWLKLTLRQPQTGEAVTSHFIANGAQLFEFGIAVTEPDIVSVYGRMLASFKFLK